MSRRTWTWCVGVSTFTLLLLAALFAWKAIEGAGKAIPGLLLDPRGYYSAVHFPTWPEAAPPLRFPDRLASVDGEAVRSVLDYERKVQARPVNTTVELTFERHSDGAKVSLRRRVVAISKHEIAFFFGLYVLAALLVLWSGAAALWLAGPRPGALAYAVWTVAIFGFLSSFYDYHVTRAAPLVFSVSSAWAPGLSVIVAYAFPTVPKRSAIGNQVAIAIPVVVSMVFSAWFLGEEVHGWDALPLRVFIAYAGPAGLAVLVGMLVLRYRIAGGRQRSQIRTVLLGMLVVPAVLAVLLLVAISVGTPVAHLALPFLVPLIPMSVGHSIIKHNMWETDAVVTRRLLLVPAVLVSVAFAIVSWMVTSAFATRGFGSALAAGTSVLLAGVLFVGLRMMLGRLLFRASTHFRPTIASLSEDLVALRSAPEVVEALVRVLKRWLPDCHVTIDSVAPESTTPGARASGDDLRTDHATVRVLDTGDQSLSVAMMFGGEVAGRINIGPKEHGGLFSQEDLALLSTVANLGAVALRNAQTLGELEELRDVERGVARDERKLAVALLGAELGHEIAYPLNYFRYLLGQVSTGRIPSKEDVQIGQEEVERLNRMLTSLRRLRAPEPNPGPVRLAEPVRRACDLVKDMVAKKGVSIVMDVNASVVVSGQFDPMVQIFANLVRNAVQAAPAETTVSVQYFEDEGVLEVADSGAGVPAEVVPLLFRSWITTRTGGTGLGLAVAQRLAKSFGWAITYGRAGGRTVFRVQLVGQQAKASTLAGSHDGDHSRLDSR